MILISSCHLIISKHFKNISKWTVNAYAANEAGGTLKPIKYELPGLVNDQEYMMVCYCGICHSDLSMLDNE